MRSSNAWWSTVTEKSHASRRRAAAEFMRSRMGTSTATNVEAGPA